jgi:hypothetical protein
MKAGGARTLMEVESLLPAPTWFTAYSHSKMTHKDLARAAIRGY